MDKKNIIYNYDGSFDGFLCCVFESFKHKEIPVDIVSVKNAQSYLLEQFNVETDLQKAQRVKKSIPLKMSGEVLAFLEECFLTCLARKEMYMLQFLIKGYKKGAQIINMLADETVGVLTKAVGHMEKEAHLYLGFVRFQIHDGVLIATIKPKNSVLPIIVDHFIQRLPNEKFLIYDETNKMVCAYAQGKYVITEAENINIPQASTTEKSYQNLWKMFYNTIGIDGRKNHKCRQTLMPKRYWSHLTEMQTEMGEHMGSPLRLCHPRGS